jgi:hypothetical protein
MRMQCLRILIALIGVASFGTAVKAQVLDQIEVDIPYEFVAAGKTHPAGTYRMKRVDVNDTRLLILSSLETRSRAIIHAIRVENSHGDKYKVSFLHVGDKHFLSKIETGKHLFTFSVSRSEILEAAAKTQSGSSALGSADGDK